MIFAACVYCDEPFALPINEDYLPMLEQGQQLVSRVECEKCQRITYVEHRRVGGEVFGEDDPRAEMLSRVG